jgi:hypothetical protein
MLRSLLTYTVHLSHQLGAHSSRNETLRWLFTSTVWHLAGPRTARAYLQHLLLPQLLDTAVSGIPGVSQVIVHCESGGHWYASTEGSNLTALYMRQGVAPPRAPVRVPVTLSAPLAINRRRCRTTNVLETLECFGLEAVCWLFCNGSLARSLGVNNAAFGVCPKAKVQSAACRLLVDHMASRGLWRGVNRTSILSSSSTLNNMRVRMVYERSY